MCFSGKIFFDAHFKVILCFLNRFFDTQFDNAFCLPHSRFVNDKGSGMKHLAKYTSIVLERGLADSQECAELLVDTLYQLAFTVVQDYLLKRR